METVISNFPASLLLSAAVGLAAGYLGSLMILRRMALVGDALSHVALPGLALGLIFHFNPFWGAFGALVIASGIIWLIEERTKLPIETLVGIFFTISLALGLLLTPEPELLEALFGDISQISLAEALWGTSLALMIVWAIAKLYRSLILGIISSDLARSLGLATRRQELFYLLLVALTVALGIKMVGTLLMGALVIIPAAAAKNLSRNLFAYACWSAVFGSLSGFLGIFLANRWLEAPGPLVVLIGALFFFLSLLFKRG